ncbi:galactose oxidase-like domain-containing protein [Gelidibacter gilvus]|nr:galactose oxidase-like domain-containing protein [Gelidibacter gilvus]
MLLLFVGFNGFSQSPQDVGRWSPPIQFEIVPVAVANLPDGRLVTWSSKYHDNFGGADGYTFTQIFDPSIGEHGAVLPSTVTDTNHDMFCPGINNLADGRLMVTGGSSDEKTSIYDPKTEVWTAAQDMNIPRGYQGAVTLSNGSAFTIGGSWNESTPDGGKDGELWTEKTGWVHLPGLPGNMLWNQNDSSGEPEGEYRLDNHAWLYAAPNGKIFHAGPGENMHWIDVDGIDSNGKLGSYEFIGKRGNDPMSMNGTTAMYDIGKILKVGGSRSYSKSTPSSEISLIIDFNDEDVIVTPTENNISKARTYVSSVVLPNGEVLILGGLDRAVVFWDRPHILTAEIFNPDSKEFRTVASMTVPRTYHSAGILLKDGRVFMGGGGLCGNCEDRNHKDAEIFSPPYLFNANGDLADRPELNAPENAYYNTELTVKATPNIKEFSFIRMSSATHSINNEQRRVPVQFTEGNNGNYTITMPDALLMPPGYYMLFAINQADVPSIAETVMVGKTDSKIKGEHLLVEFDFYEGEGDLVHDTSGKNNHGTIKERDDEGNETNLSREYWSSDGLSGNALEMDGKEHLSHSILEIPSSPSLDGIKNKITVMAWVNRNTGSVVPEAGNKIPNVAIFSHDYDRSFFMGYHDGQFKVEFWTHTSGPSGHFNGYTGEYYTPGEWEHFVTTYDSDSSIAKVYVNGEMIKSESVTGDLKINAPDNLTNNTFTLSGFYDSRKSGLPSYTNYNGISDELDGRMDKFKLYDVALSEAEILAIYNKERQDLVSEGPCDDFTLSYEVNEDDRFNLRKEISVVVNDKVNFFIDDDKAEFTIKNPQGDLLDGHVLQNMTTAQSGEYTINVTLQQDFTAKNLSVESVSSEQPEGQTQHAPAVRAIDGNPSSFWHTQWLPKLDLKYPPHYIVLRLEETVHVSGLEYLPRQDHLNGTIEKYEIYVSSDPPTEENWGEKVADGVWEYNDNLKTIKFPAMQGRYVSLVSLGPWDESMKEERPWASAAEIRIKTSVITECEQVVKINVHQPQTYVFNDGWVTDNPSGESKLIDDIIIESGVALLSKPTMANTVTIQPGAALRIDDKDVILTVNTTILNSRSDSFSSLIHNGWVTGQVHYYRHVNKMGTSEGGGNDLISSPIFGGQFDAQFVAENSNLPENPENPGEFAFAPFSVTANRYENINIGSAHTLEEPIVSGKGYRTATYNGNALVFKGSITNNPIEIAIFGSPEKGLWNLIGNPYSSYLDFEMFFEVNKDQFEAAEAYQAVYGYTGKSGQWTILNNLSFEDPNLQPKIAPGQGFFVKSKIGGGIVQFTPEMRKPGTSDDFIQGRPNKNIALSKLNLIRGASNVSTSVYFVDGSTKGIDPGYDAAAYAATKVDFLLFTNLIEGNKGLDIAIQALPYEDFNDVIVPLGIRAKGGEELTISIDDLSTLPSNVKVYLEDTQNNTLTLLNDDVFKFTPTMDIDGSGRFNVHYSSKTLSLGDLDANDNLRIYTTASPKTLYITGQLTGATTAYLYDIQGRLVLNKALNPHTTENTMDISTMSTGVYVVKLNNDHQIKTQKVIVK